MSRTIYFLILECSYNVGPKQWQIYKSFLDQLQKRRIYQKEYMPKVSSYKVKYELNLFAKKGLIRKETPKKRQGYNPCFFPTKGYTLF